MKYKKCFTIVFFFFGLTLTGFGQDLDSAIRDATANSSSLRRIQINQLTKGVTTAGENHKKAVMSWVEFVESGATRGKNFSKNQFPTLPGASISNDSNSIDFFYPASLISNVEGSPLTVEQKHFGIKNVSKAKVGGWNVILRFDDDDKLIEILLKFIFVAEK